MLSTSWIYLWSWWLDLWVLEIQPFVVVTYISLFGTLGRYATCSPRIQVFPSSPLHSTGGKHYIHSYDTTLTYCTCSSPARSLGPTHVHANSHYSELWGFLGPDTASRCCSLLLQGSLNGWDQSGDGAVFTPDCNHQAHMKKRSFLKGERAVFWGSND